MSDDEDVNSDNDSDDVEDSDDLGADDDDDVDVDDDDDELDVTAAAPPPQKNIKFLIAPTAAASATTSTAAANPFGKPAASPFGAATANPFGAPAASPFGAPSAAPAASPFGTAAPVASLDSKMKDMKLAGVEPVKSVSQLKADTDSMSLVADLMTKLKDGKYVDAAPLNSKLPIDELMSKKEDGESDATFEVRKRAVAKLKQFIEEKNPSWDKFQPVDMYLMSKILVNKNGQTPVVYTDDIEKYLARLIEDIKALPKK